MRQLLHRSSFDPFAILFCSAEPINRVRKVFVTVAANLHQFYSFEISEGFSPPLSNPSYSHRFYILRYSGSYVVKDDISQIFINVIPRYLENLKSTIDLC